MTNEDFFRALYDAFDTFRQPLRNLDGDVIADLEATHIFRPENGLLVSFEIADGDGRTAAN